jgi:hypothetical protein
MHNRYERFTDRARKVGQLANQEALRFNHEAIETEHLLLGLIKEGGGVAAQVLEQLEVDPRKIRLEVEKRMLCRPDPVEARRLPLARRAERVLELAIEESRHLGHDYQGTEHLLLGLLGEPKGLAGQVLRELGLEPDLVRERVLALFRPGDDEEQSDTPGPAPSVAPIEPRSDLPLHKERPLWGAPVWARLANLLPLAVVRRLQAREQARAVARLEALLPQVQRCRDRRELEALLGPPRYALEGGPMDQVTDFYGRPMSPDRIEAYYQAGCVIDLWFATARLGSITGFVMPTVWDVILARRLPPDVTGR